MCEKVTSKRRGTIFSKSTRKRQNCKKFSEKEQGKKLWKIAISSSLLRRNETLPNELPKRMTSSTALVTLHSHMVSRLKSRDRCWECATETTWLLRLLAGQNSVKSWISWTRHQVSKLQIWMESRQLTCVEMRTIKLSLQILKLPQNKVSLLCQSQTRFRICKRSFWLKFLCLLAKIGHNSIDVKSKTPLKLQSKMLVKGLKLNFWRRSKTILRLKSSYRISKTKMKTSTRFVFRVKSRSKALSLRSCKSRFKCRKLNESWSVESCTRRQTWHLDPLIAMRTP